MEENGWAAERTDQDQEIALSLILGKEGFGSNVHRKCNEAIPIFLVFSSEASWAESVLMGIYLPHLGRPCPSNREDKLFACLHHCSYVWQGTRG